MNNQQNSSLSLSLIKKRLLILVQFFLIIFVYHTLKDLKDTIVITASDAGAEIIPFIKIWAMLPLAIVASYFFSKLYNRFGREKTLYIFVLLLLGTYALFAFILYPLRSELYLSRVADYLQAILPVGAKGFIAMIGFWHYTLFYLAAELWSLLILSVLFWSYVNETTTLSEAKQFYPLCMFTGNFAGIISGQTSHYLCHHLADVISWQSTLQCMVIMVAICGISIMVINRLLSRSYQSGSSLGASKKKRSSLSFKDNLLCIAKSPPLLCIAILVVGFGLTTNLIEVVWKENIKHLYPSPQAYNAYINQLTSMIGTLAVCMALLSRWIFQKLNWTQIALMTPISLFVTSLLFFVALLMPQETLSNLSTYLGVSPLYLVVSLGSLYYVLGMTAKYTIFDTSKEMAFLSIEPEDRTRAKSVIDSIGSRLGKSGASCFYQFLLLTFGAASGHVSLIGIISVSMIGISIFATKKLGGYLSEEREREEYRLAEAAN